MIGSFGFSGALAVDCSNEGLKRCAEPNGKSARFFECSNGKEVESTCKTGETCHGNGDTSTMCINVPAFKKRQKLMKRDTAFGGYEPLVNEFNGGMYGDAQSFNKFCTNMRSMMFVDKNSLGDVTGSVGNGVRNNRSKIGQNSQDIGKLSQTTQGQNTLIKGAKSFSNSLNQNKAEYSYLVADVATNTKHNKQGRDGLSSVMTNTFTATADGASGGSQISGVETKQALTNLDFALNAHYPGTLGKVFSGNLSPDNLGNNVAALSSGNSNGTANIFGSLVANTKEGTEYLAPFTAGAVQLTDSTAQYASASRMNSVFRKYQPSSISSSSTVNILNGAANAAVNSKGKFRSSLDNSMIAYKSTVDNNKCGCGNSDAYGSMMAMSAALAMTQMAAPSGSCCFPSRGGGAGGNMFLRSLII
ncbi:hypothetical protein BB561_005631 [Smittium simulii]|uniref:Uncharacterized protein n=1 Tax=Smittium simulii TaxID=133385 RepID=A0A2T9Y9F1_9FUNG|nr:hypothetical protein BB561_005631 [Smittium simulii]